MVSLRSSICRLRDTKVHKVTNSYGVYDAYKYYRKNKPSDKKYILTESQYFAIIRKINLLLCEDLLNSKSISFPKYMGTIEIAKANIKVKEVNGKLKIPYRIDWAKTISLWETDEEARRDKTLVRYYTPVAYMFKYIKRRSRFKNKNFYEFKPNRTLKRNLADRIKQCKFDTFYYENS